MTAIAALRIDGPLPVAAPYGLTNTPGVLADELDEHWQAGVYVEGYPADLPLTHDPCSVGTLRVKEEGAPPPTGEFGSFTVYFPMTCSGLGLGNEEGAERMRNRARLALEATESYAVEKELAEAPSNTLRPHLTDAQLQYPIGMTAVSPMEALEALEQEIGRTARGGFIHADPATGTSWLALGGIAAEGATMRTKRGNTVIIGNGYIDSGPGAAPEWRESWAYATGPVRVIRSEPFVPDLRSALNRTTNVATFRAEREYVAYWDTALQAAVLIDRSLEP
jgi:hypothetical protein